MTPYQFIWIQVRSIAGQEIQSQFLRYTGDVFLDKCFLVRWQAIDRQSHWFFASVHHLLEQLDKQLARQAALVGGKPERAFGADS